MNNDTPALRLHNVRFSYEGQDVLEDVTCSVTQGSYVGIVGPNGGGKTTLLKVILGLLKPSEGTVSILGMTPLAARKAGKIGYVPQRVVQSDFVFPATAEEVVRSGRSRSGRIGRWFAAQDKSIAEEAMKTAGIWHLRHRLVGTLSGGERQKVFIARALAAEPAILILDEPTTGVDASSQEEFYALLRTLHRGKGLTVLFVSHDVEVMANEASNILCLNKRLVADCSAFQSANAEDLARASATSIITMRIEALLRAGLSLCLLCAALVPSAGMAQDAPARDAFVKAEVVDIRSETTEEDASAGTRTVQTATMRVIGGADDGQEFVYEHGVLGSRTESRLKEGETLVMEKLTMPDGTEEFQYRDKYRLGGLGWVFAFFLMLAFVIGGRTSLMSVGGLLVSIGILVLFVIPSILAGHDPLFVSLLGCAAIAFTSLYLAHGFSKRTSVALLSTLLTLGISTIVAVVFVNITRLLGMGSEESQFIQLSQLQDLDLRGLLLGGILIGCLGVLDDITTAQTAAVDEISKANPSLSAVQLRKAGFSVGKEHIASLINTLALAYVGASLPLLLLLRTQGDFPLWVTLNSEFLAEEIVRTLVGSATLLFAVPISTWCAAYFLKAEPGSRPRTGHGHPHSHHHHA